MNTFSATLKKILSILLVLSIILSLGYFVLRFLSDRKASPPPLPDVSESLPSAQLPPEEERPSLHIKRFQTGDFGPDEERLTYQSGDMILAIPRLNYVGPVLSVDLATMEAEGEAEGLSKEVVATKSALAMDTLLDEGIVLFNQALLPGPENRNVSIAGHRDTKGMEFFYIDTLTNGDYIYLYYQNKEYIYEYEKTVITNDADWSQVAISDISQIALQSCDPIFAPNQEYDRIFVIGKLINIVDLNKSGPSTGMIILDPAEESSTGSKTETSSESSDDPLSISNWEK